MSILLDFIKVATNSHTLIQERDQAVLDYAEAQCKYIQANDHKRKLHKENQALHLLLEEARADNIALEAALAMTDTDAEHTRREAWMAWSERLLTKANEQADLAGRRVLALEAWVVLKGGDRDAIYLAGGLPVVSDPKPEPVVTEEAS